jgi:hypothetical protein
METGKCPATDAENLTNVAKLKVLGIQNSRRRRSSKRTFVLNANRRAKPRVVSIWWAMVGVS